MPEGEAESDRFRSAYNELRRSIVVTPSAGSQSVFEARIGMEFVACGNYYKEALSKAIAIALSRALFKVRELDSL